jgi:formylglycine-generating enzyme required for sulfatase activity
MCAAWWVGGATGALGTLGCSSGPERKVEEDPYGPRVAQCIEAPRGVSDAAMAHMIALPPGSAVLGSTDGERMQARRDYGPGGERLFNDESRARRAHVRGFRLDRSPVTNLAFAEIVAACGMIPPDAESITVSVWAELAQRFGLRARYGEVERFLWQPGGLPPEQRGEHPMVLVTYDEAAFYCAWRGGRLPTADEWERAARGPSGNVYPWGPSFDPFRANVALRGAGDTLEVGERPTGTTGEGFTDMGGHVMEWTSTRAPGRDGYVLVKGNGWDGRGGYGRGAASRVLPVAQRDITLGFRCAQ